MKISKVKGRNLYMANVPKPSGGYKKIYGKTKKEVREKAESLITEMRMGRFVENNDMTCAEWFREWLTQYLGDITESSRNTYTSVCEKWLVPSFGSERLQSLTHHSVQAFVTRISGELAPKSVRNVHLVLHRSLRDAVKNGYIGTNPADDIILPKLKQREMMVLDANEINLFLEDARKNEPEYADCLEFLILTGLRIAEFTGLTVDSYDRDTGVLTIDKQWSASLKKYTEPKHGKTRRIVLAKRAREIIEKRIKKRGPTETIFLNPGMRVISETTLRKVTRRIAGRIGKPGLRVHDLRHTNATISLMSGVDVKTIASNLGHATPEFTLHKYAHSTDSMQKLAADRLDAFFNNLTQN